MKNQAGTSRLDTVLKMLLIAFISLLAFSSGVYFGKEMSDSDYKLKALESDFKEQKEAEHKNLDQKADEALVDEEVAALSDKMIASEKDKLKDEPVEQGDRSVASEKHDDAHHDDHGKVETPVKAATHDTHVKAEAKGHDAHAAKPAAKQDAPAKISKTTAHESEPVDHADHAPAAKKPDLTEVHKVAKRVANNEAPTEPRKPSAEPRSPQSLPKTVGASADFEFTVQVASYPSAEEAKKHVDELIKKGFPAYPVEAAVGGKNWYRVSVGSFKSQKEAGTYRAQLMKQAEIKSAIVQKIQR